MRKTWIAVVVLALAASLAASAAPPINAPAAEEPGVDGLFVVTEHEVCADDPAVADEIALLFQPTIWHCPFNAPHCRRHDDCDAYCGDPRFGHCFSNGCCGCSG